MPQCSTGEIDVFAVLLYLNQRDQGEVVRLQWQAQNEQQTYVHMLPNGCRSRKTGPQSPRNGR